MQSSPQQTGPLRLVVILDGDNVLAVQCGQPVEVVFASYAPDALEDHGHGCTDLDGKPVVLWMDGSEGHSAERPIVEHLFGQYCQTGSLSDLDREPISGEVADHE